MLIVLVVAGFAIVSIFLASSAGKEVQVLKDHLEAVAVGESVFARMLARLEAVPWTRRWFRDQPDVGFDLPSPTGCGNYEYLIRNANPVVLSGDPLTDSTIFTPHQVDLLIRPSCGKSSATMYWRLTLPADSLEGFRRVIPAFFTFLSPEVGARASDLDEIGKQLGEWIVKRQENSRSFDRIRRRLGEATEATEIATLLEVDPVRPVVDEVACLTREDPGVPGSAAVARSSDGDPGDRSPDQRVASTSRDEVCPRPNRDYLKEIAQTRSDPIIDPTLAEPVVDVPAGSYSSWSELRRVMSRLKGLVGWRPGQYTDLEYAVESWRERLDAWFREYTLIASYRNRNPKPEFRLPALTGRRAADARSLEGRAYILIREGRELAISRGFDPG